MRAVLRTVLTSARLRAASPKQERVTRRAVTLVPRNGSRVIHTGERQDEVPLLGHLGEPVSA